MPYGTWDLEMGYGRVNAFEAIRMADGYQSSVGLKNSTPYVPFALYPNPSNGLVTFSNNVKETQTFTISNTIGQVLTLLDVRENEQKTIQLPSGLYFVQSSIGKNNVQRLLVK
jgi:hypothetical protein